jgi:hypothetical protein
MKTKKEEEEKDVKTHIPGVLDMGSKIEVPETKEEFEAIASGVSGSKKEEKKEEEEEEINEGDEDVLITEDSPLYLHAATLLEEGILPTLNLEDFKGKKYSEALKIIFDKQQEYFESGKNEYKNSLTDRQKEFLDMIEKGIPQEQVEHQISIEDTYSKITDEVLADDEELQEQIIIQNFRLKNLEDKQIDVFIEAAKEKKTLFEDAKKAKDNINAFIKSQKEEMIKAADNEHKEAEKREREMIAKVKTAVDGLTEILPGVKISAKEKTDIYELMTKPVEIRNVNGKKIPVNIINKTREADPVDFNLRLIYYIQQGLFSKDKDITKINKKMTSTAAQKLAMKLKGDDGALGQGTQTLRKKKNDKPAKVIFPKF